MTTDDETTSPTISRRADVLWRTVFDRTVLLPPGASEPLYLSGTAERVWLLLENPATFDALIDALASDFGAARSVIESDVAGFLEDLAAHGLVSIP